jgi:hypothetical protein
MFTKSKFFQKFAFVLIALAVMASGFGFAPRVEAAAPERATCTLWHTFKEGENLYDVARSYGLKWQYIAYWNSFTLPGQVKVGDVICVQAKGKGRVGEINQGGQSGKAYYEIRGVTKDKNVTIRTYRFPSYTVYDVYMDESGTTGANGYLVDTFNSGKGGTFSLTFNIPSQLRGESRLVIRVENRKSGAYQTITFKNTTSGSQGSSGGGGSTVPSGVGRRVDSSNKRLAQGKETDLRFGSGGAYFESASQNGYVEITRLTLNDTRRLHFVELGMDVRMYNNNDVEVGDVRGSVYIYFLLNADTRELWRDGDLDVYYYNPSSKAWQVCDATYVNDRNRPYGRLLCEVDEFGIYGLAERR